MNAAGVIVEFNPFHNGHLEHINETRRLTERKYIVAIMSGNFVQRGEPAICDKWQRTKMALLAGVDIVIELPVYYVVSGADYFARGSVKLLEATKVVDKLCFGSESGDLVAINAAGRILADEPIAYKDVLRRGLDAGLSFAAARGEALESVISTEKLPEGLLTKPNNGLAMEYCKALWQMGKPMEPFTTHRVKGGPSATKIRKSAWRGDRGNEVKDIMPLYAYNLLMEAADKHELAHLDAYSDIFRYLLYTLSDCTLASLGEGLENRFRRLCNQHNRLSDLLFAVKTKRYTYTRLQRAALGLVLGLSHKDLQQHEAAGGPAYIRVLGFKKSSADLLGEITRRASLPVITHNSAIEALPPNAASMLAKEYEAGDIYRLALSKPGAFRHERSIPMVIL